jgi:superfamily II DNA or RNA helicase
MISKLSNYTPRTEFVLRVLRDLLDEHEDSQIMVLAHQRELLKYIHDAVVARGIADGSVGYYVGGMKETALKITEGKQIVLATYAMAAEALDIKTLSTLVMITPKTDIIQSVGRILRMKHDHPIVVDIVDKHDNFQKQWIQRRRFYKKCNYRIRYITSAAYNGMDLDWDNDKTWKWTFEPKGGLKECVDEYPDEEEEEVEKKPKSGGCLIDASALAELETFHEQQHK